MAIKQASEKFSKALHLLNKRDFDRVFKGAIRLKSPSMLVLARKNDLGHARLGFAISKKNAKLAVSRNRIKRVVRESFRLHIYKIGAYDVIVLGKPGLDRLNRKEIRREIDQQWLRLK